MTRATPAAGGSGLRLMECVRLRVTDLDFERSKIVVRAARGDKDRRTMIRTVQELLGHETLS